MLSQHPLGDDAADGSSAWPKRVPFAWKTKEYDTLVQLCHDFNMVFPVELPTIGPAWEQLYQQVMAHCREEELVLTGYRDDVDPEGPNYMPFALLTSGPAKGTSAARRFSVDTSLNPETFTVKSLTAKTFSTPPYAKKSPPTWAKLPFIRLGESFTPPDTRPP